MIPIIVKTTSPKDRMIESAALLIRERGVQATSFSDVLAHSGAPRGSIYHHFPGGKAQLVEAATRYAGEFTAAGLASALSEHDPVQAIKRFCELWQRILERSDFADGCPVVAVTLEGESSPAARVAAAGAFAAWEQLIAGALIPHGVPSERAAGIASLVIAAIEGGVVLARAERSTAPLERVAAELERLLVTALAAGSARER
ncbi:MAG TPA: TetR/AcrR family transcriptional regulator [Solirubrobacteraceae bacterium]|jgi:AcrR family transcriptional regulator|nr:TetR/AcrR family transcriptional regulator [Solirubrobacteraceae bacterium]